MPLFFCWTQNVLFCGVLLIWLMQEPLDLQLLSPLLGFSRAEYFPSSGTTCQIFSDISFFLMTSALSPLTLSVVCFFVVRFWNLLPMSWPSVSRVWSNCCFHSLYSLTLSLVCSLIFSLLLWLFLTSFLDFFKFFFSIFEVIFFIYCVFLFSFVRFAYVKSVLNLFLFQA